MSLSAVRWARQHSQCPSWDSPVFWDDTFDISPQFISEHLPGACLGVVGDKRTKMSRILYLPSGRPSLAMFWKEPPPLWEFQGEERQGSLDGCTEGPRAVPRLGMPAA